MLISQYLMHRDARYFPKPEKFDPERWAAGQIRALPASLPRFAYFPFGGGPRVCIGAGFAMMEAVLLLATIAQQFQVQIASGETISMQPSVTLRPRNGIPATLKRRVGHLTDCSSLPLHRRATVLPPSPSFHSAIEKGCRRSMMQPQSTDSSIFITWSTT